MHKLSWILDNMKDGEFAKATFAGDSHWYIINSCGVIRYCDENGDNAYEIILLTFSNMGASYKIMN